MKKFVVILGMPLALLSLTAFIPAERAGIVEKVSWLRSQFLESENEVGRVVKLEKSVTPIGTIISSATPYDVMPDSFKDSWVPADGSPVDTKAGWGKLIAEATDSKKRFPHLWNKEKTQVITPNLRGMFLRGLNKFTDVAVKVDPDTRSVAHPQNDSFGNHVHALPADSQGHHAGERQSLVHSGNRDEKVSGAQPSGGAISGRYSSETRPKNVAVYYYIKVK